MGQLMIGSCNQHTVYLVEGFSLLKEKESCRAECCVSTSHCESVNVPGASNVVVVTTQHFHFSGITST